MSALRCAWHCRIRATGSSRRRWRTNEPWMACQTNEVVLGVPRVSPAVVRPLQRQLRLCKQHASIGVERRALHPGTMVRRSKRQRDASVLQRVARGAIAVPKCLRDSANILQAGKDAVVPLPFSEDRCVAPPPRTCGGGWVHTDFSVRRHSHGAHHQRSRERACATLAASLNLEGRAETWPLGPMCGTAQRARRTLLTVAHSDPLRARRVKRSRAKVATYAQISHPQRRSRRATSKSRLCAMTAASGVRDSTDTPQTCKQFAGIAVASPDRPSTRHPLRFRRRGRTVHTSRRLMKRISFSRKETANGNTT